MSASPLRYLLVAAMITAPVAASAQRMSDSYEFLKAVRDSDGKKVTEFLDKPGATIVNTKDKDSGETAMHIVVKRGDVTYMRFLLGRGAGINVQDGKGNSPIMLAVSTCPECVEQLITLRANLNLANASGETPLIRAVQLRNLDMAQKLLTAGANPDQRDFISGQSARDYAKADTRSPALTKLLTEAGKSSGKAVSGPVLR